MDKSSTKSATTWREVDHGRYGSSVGSELNVDGEADTLNVHCPLCAARAHVDATLVRAGVERVTIVVEYLRTRVGPAAMERARVILSLPAGLVKGEGHSREEAIVNALLAAGVSL